MQAFRTLKHSLSKYIASKTTSSEVPADPLGYVIAEITAAAAALMKSKNLYNKCMRFRLPSSGSISLTINDLSRQRESLFAEAKIIQAEFPKGIFEKDGSLIPIIEEICRLANCPMPPNNKVQDLWMFAFCRGKLFEKTIECWANFGSEHDRQENLLGKATQRALEGDYKTAQRLLDEMKCRFSDLNYETVEEIIASWQQSIDGIVKLHDRVYSTVMAPISLPKWRLLQFCAAAKYQQNKRHAMIDELSCKLKAFRDDIANLPASEIRRDAENSIRSLSIRIAEMKAFTDGIVRPAYIRLTAAILLALLFAIFCLVQWLQHRPGRISVISSYDWEVILDNKWYGSPSGALTGIKVGQHHLQLRRAGTSYFAPVFVRPGRLTLVYPDGSNPEFGKLNLRLESKPAINHFLVVRKDVKLVQLGNNSTNMFFSSDIGSSLVFSNLPIGRYRVEVSAPGYNPDQSSKVIIEAGKTSTKSVTICASNVLLRKLGYR